MNSWKIFKGTPNKPHSEIERLPDPPNWRNFDEKSRGINYKIRAKEVELVNAALYLRRALLITGKPGTGKTSLAYAVAQELQLGEVLRWNITTRSTLQEGLYRYDAIGRLQENQLNPEDSLAKIGKYIQLGPLGTALVPSENINSAVSSQDSDAKETKEEKSKNEKPRVLLIDEIDKSDLDLPNDLLNVLEEGKFEIPELARIAEQDKNLSEITVKSYENNHVKIIEGEVQCKTFPFVILTSNGEREFPPAFLRRCIRLYLPEPTEEQLTEIVTAYLEPDVLEKAKPIIEKFLNLQKKGQLATDQLLNVIYLLTRSIDRQGKKIKAPVESEADELVKQLLQYLSSREE